VKPVFFVHIRITLLFFAVSITAAGAIDSSLKLSLADAVETALANNISIQNERLAVENSESVLRAGLSPWAPRIGLNADTVYSHNGTAGSNSTIQHHLRTDVSKRFATTGGTLSLYSDMVRHDDSSLSCMEGVHDVFGTYSSTLGVRIQQPLIKNAGPWNDIPSIQRNRLTFENSLYRYIQAQRRLILDVVILYFNTMKQDKLMEVARRGVKDAEIHQKNTLIRLEEGLVAQMDVSQAELQLARQQTTLIRAQQNTAGLFDALKLILNVPLDTDLILTESIDRYDEPVDPGKAISEALNQRLEIRVLKNDILIAEQAVKQTMNQRMPALDLLMNAETSNRNDQFTETLRFDDEFSNFSVGFSYTFGDRSDRENWNQARLHLRKMENELEHLKRLIEKEVRDEIRHYQALIEAMNVSAQSLAIAEKNLELATESYREGLTGNLDLIKAQDDLITAGTNYYSDILDLATAKARILHVLGRDIDADNLTLQPTPAVQHSETDNVRQIYDTIFGDLTNE
jgi:outer membrane protein TolC